MLSYVNVSEFRFSSLYLQMDRERMAGVKQLGREGGWRLKHSILWSHMYCQLHLASLQVSLYLYHVKVIYFTVPKVPLCCFGRQYGNISKIFFEIGKKKNWQWSHNSNAIRATGSKKSFLGALFLAETHGKQTHSPKRTVESPPQEACLDQACTFSTRTPSTDSKWIWTSVSV